MALNGQLYKWQWSIKRSVSLISFFGFQTLEWIHDSLVFVEGWDLLSLSWHRPGIWKLVWIARFSYNNRYLLKKIFQTWFRWSFRGKFINDCFRNICLEKSFHSIKHLYSTDIFFDNLSTITKNLQVCHHLISDSGDSLVLFVIARSSSLDELFFSAIHNLSCQCFDAEFDRHTLKIFLSE